jgi:hypothetical protein
MVRLVVGLLLLLAAAACSSGGTATSSPTPTTAEPTTSPTPTFRPGDLLFRGIVRAVNRGCEADATCSVTVEVAEPLTSGLPREREITVVTGYGRGPRHCSGSWSPSETASGLWVEVLARKTVDGGYAICFEERDYISVPMAVPDLYDRKVSFRGTVVGFDNGCAMDGWCSSKVRVDQIFRGDLEQGSVVEVNEVCGFCFPECRGIVAAAGEGSEIEVTAERRSDGSISICPDATLGVRLLATATPWCGEPSCPPTFPPSVSPTATP